MYPSFRKKDGEQIDINPQHVESVDHAYDGVVKLTMVSGTTHFISAEDWNAFSSEVIAVRQAQMQRQNSGLVVPQ